MPVSSRFDDQFCEQFRELLRWRRDVRRFRPDPLAAGLLEELLGLSRFAPSVGLSQSWRYVRVASPELRKQVRADFEAANAHALTGYSGERAKLYANLKLSGLDLAPVQLAVFADDATEKGAGLGRETMPEMIEYSAVCAVNTLWLAARAYGVGVGWVSILDPGRIRQILAVPKNWRLIAYLCIGFPAEESETPELERVGWESRDDAVFLLER